ncbi:uncharacterized protein LOC134911103 [Pseudophryne corroboree]|uniref:uncharacterized protein LOC134911103 n=1 Tax=Pseudophryne corroboree TaxID=495146 RepID=UPI003081EBB5
MSIEFSDHDFWTGFIELYRSHECLWRVKSKEYVNREKKLKAYQELIDYSKGRNSQVDIRWVKKRIQNFRTVFHKEHKRVIESQRSGAGSDEVRRPSLWYYNLLMFTLEQEPRTESVCSAMPESPEGVLEEEVGTEELLSPLATEGNPPMAEHAELEVIEVEPVPPQPSQPPTRRRRLGPRTSSSGEERTHQFLNRAEEILQRPPDEQMIFGMNIACEMQSLEPTQRQRFKTIVYDALICAQNGQLPERLILPSNTLRWPTPPVTMTSFSYPAHPPQPNPPPHQPPSHTFSRAPPPPSTTPNVSSDTHSAWMSAQATLQDDPVFFNM